MSSGDKDGIYMTNAQVGDWIEHLLKKEGIGISDAYSMKQKFKDNGIDGETLLKLDRDFIRNSIGITKPKEILLIEEAISKLRQGKIKSNSL
jgi:hypothetical protein